MKIRISSRQSALAQIQAYQVGEALQKTHPDLEVEYFFRESLGDQNQNDPLWKMPDKGVFTQDFLSDLIHHKTDLVVHSWKDLPTEHSPLTLIAATLPRADQRDLLLLKKSSFQKKYLKIFSCSPRRAYNIQNFLKWALPWSTERVQFDNVRGNVQTRVRKLMESSETDGLVVAKAALDRLFENEKRFPDVVAYLRSCMKDLSWMVIPLADNPNAAAQGALAIEVARDRNDILQLVSTINCEASYQSAQKEREILKEFGGGCHLALGMSVLSRGYGSIQIVRGLTPSGEPLRVFQFQPLRKMPSELKKIRPEMRAIRHSIPVHFHVEPFQNLFIAKAEALLELGLNSAQIQSNVVWAAGQVTWKRLAENGFWVHGCQEALGQNEPKRLDSILSATGRGQAEWIKLSHVEASEMTAEKFQTHSSEEMKSFGTYRVSYELPENFLPQPACAYIWKSASEFSFALQRFPELKNCFHVCGPGRSYDRIKEALGSDEKIFVELSDEFISTI